MIIPLPSIPFTRLVILFVGKTFHGWAYADFPWRGHQQWLIRIFQKAFSHSEFSLQSRRGWIRDLGARFLAYEYCIWEAIHLPVWWDFISHSDYRPASPITSQSWTSEWRWFLFTVCITQKAFHMLCSLWVDRAFIVSCKNQNIGWSTQVILPRGWLESPLSGCQGRWPEGLVPSALWPWLILYQWLLVLLTAHFSVLFMQMMVLLRSSCVISYTL